ERETGVEQADLKDKTLRDANTGEPVGWVVTRARYDAAAFEDRLLLPERVAAMARDLFDHLLATGGPEQKTIVFCARDRHADDVDGRVTDAGQYLVTSVDGQARLVTVDEYRARLARRLVEEVPSLEQFRARWIVPPERREMLGRLPDAGRSALLVRALAEMTDFDLYDVLAELGYGLAPRTRPDRAEAFGYKHADWLSALPPATAATLQALTAQFARTGTDGLESPEVFSLPEVVRAGGLAALRSLGRPAEILREAKARLFAA